MATSEHLRYNGTGAAIKYIDKKGEKKDLCITLDLTVELLVQEGINSRLSILPACHVRNRRLFHGARSGSLGASCCLGQPHRRDHCSLHS